MLNLPKNPSLYEINTRVWLRRFDTPTQRATIKNVPASYWDEFAELGINIIWLMGVWKNNPSVVEKFSLSDELTAGYRRALPDWRREDVIGSPYSVDSYTVNPYVGDLESLKTLRTALHQRGMYLMLDFVPNHFSAHSHLIQLHPEIFLQGNDKALHGDPTTFYRVAENNLIFAHGRDPYFPAWTDSVQVNYFSLDARRFMTEALLQLAELCDGVRCDMAMLMLNDIFSNTWRPLAGEMHYRTPEEEFWPQAIGEVKARFPHFLFMAEAYWDKEWTLQQQGFDFTYDKRLLDRLRYTSVESIRGHLQAEASYQAHSVRFLENHDEERAVTALGQEKSLAAAVVVSTIPGMRFYHDGQFQGKRIHLPIQLGREPDEPPQQVIQDFYRKLLTITKADIFTQGDWQLFSITAAPEGDLSYRNILAWLWQYSDKRCLVAVNITETPSHCLVQLKGDNLKETLELTDLLSGRIFPIIPRGTEAIELSLEFKSFQSQIFTF